MHTRQNPFSIFILILLSGAFFATYIWFNDQMAVQGRGGDEFFIQWNSGRRLAFQAINPYNGPLTLPTSDRISAYSPPENGLRFNTPIYSLFVVFPFVLVKNFHLAFRLWLLSSYVFLLILIWGCFSLTSWKPGRFLTIVLVLFVSFSFITIHAFSSGNLILLTSLFVVLGFLALQSNRYELAGILFALTTIQPHYFILLYGLLVVWGISKRKWNFILWFIFSVVALSIIGSFIIPDWIATYLRILWHFEDNFVIATPVKLLQRTFPGLGKQLGWGISITMLVICLVEWWLVRGKDFRWLFWTACLTIVAGQWVGLFVEAPEFFILTIPLIQIVSVWAQRAVKSRLSLIGLTLTAFLILTWLIEIRRGLPGSLITPSLIHYFLLPFIVLVGLYWVRWWAIRPTRLYFEELQNHEAV